VDTGSGIGILRGDKGAIFLTQPLKNPDGWEWRCHMRDPDGWEWRCHMRDPDGYLIEVGQDTQMALDGFKGDAG